MQPTANFSTQRVLNAGARPQRLLWASTRTKNPSASDLLYVKALAAPFTVNTMPEKTLNALADHGESGGILSPEGGNSEIVLAEFASAGINIDDLTALLQDEGAKSFVKSWNDLICCIESKSKPSSKLAFVIQQLDFQEGSAVMTTQLKPAGSCHAGRNPRCPWGRDRASRGRSIVQHPSKNYRLDSRLDRCRDHRPACVRCAGASSGFLDKPTKHRMIAAPTSFSSRITLQVLIQQG
jgi:hypothetical protein